MTDKGSGSNLIVSSNWILKQGSDQYILKNDLQLNLSRPRFREAIDIGPVNSFGAGDHLVPVVFEADIAQSINWANLNARDLDGSLPVLDYSLQMSSASFTGSGAGAALGTVSISDGRVTGIAISSGGTGYTSIIITLTGGTSTTPAKAVAIVKAGVLTQVIIIDQGTGVTAVPTAALSEVTSPFTFSFNASVGDVSFSQSDNEGRVKINATLVVTDDAPLPVKAA